MKTSFFSRILLLTVIFQFAASITASANVNKNREIAMQERMLPAFTAIRADGSFSIKVMQNDLTKVCVEADKNALQCVETQVENGCLSITYTGTETPENTKILICMPELKEITLSGSAFIETTGNICSSTLKLTTTDESGAKLTISTEVLTSHISGTSMVDISGDALIHQTTVTDIACLNAQTLKTISTDATIRGAGICRILTAPLISADLGEAGMLSYRDNQEVNRICKTGIFEIIPESSDTNFSYLNEDSLNINYRNEGAYEMGSREASKESDNKLFLSSYAQDSHDSFFNE